MARVPIITAPSIGAAPISRERFRPADNDGGVLGGLAKGMAGLAGQVEDLGNVLDDAAVKRQENLGAQRMREVLWTGSDPYFSKQGFDAANARAPTEKALADLREELMGGLTTAHQRGMFARSFDVRMGAELEGVARHAIGQIAQEEKTQSTARIQNFLDDAVTSSDDPKKFGLYLDGATTELRTRADKEGWAPEALQNAETRLRSDANASVVRKKLAVGDVEGASAWREANRGQLNPATETALDEALYTPLLERRADGVVDDLLGTAPPSTAPQGAAAEKVGVVLPRMAAITAQSESGSRERGRDGRLITSSAGAQGKMQVMPGTRIDPGFGIKPAQNDSDEERTRVGRDYLAAMMKRYGNDPAKAWAAYNWGPGKLDKAIAANGDQWLSVAPAETRAYVRGNMAALGGRGPAIQQAPQEHNMTELLARVDELNLPFDVEQKVRRQLTERVGTDERLLARNRAQAAEQAWEIVDRTKATRESAIPQTLWNQMDVGDRRSIRTAMEQNAKGEVPKTDYGTYTELSDLYARDPQAFAKRLPSTYATKLAPADYEQVLGWRRDALGEQAKQGRGDSQVTHSRISGIVNNAVQGVGLTTTGISTRSQRDRDARTAVSKRVYQLETAVARDVQIWQQQNPNKQISDLEISGITDRLLIRWAPQGQDLDLSKPGQFAFERNGQGGKFAVPRADYQRLKTRGRAILGYTPSDDDITQAYLREARGGR